MSVNILSVLNVNFPIYYPLLLMKHLNSELELDPFELKIKSQISRTIHHQQFVL